jgi:hypothetical protein
MFIHNRDIVDVLGFGKGCVADRIQRVQYLKQMADAGNSYVENQSREITSVRIGNCKGYISRSGVSREVGGSWECCG